MTHAKSTLCHFIQGTHRPKTGKLEIKDGKSVTIVETQKTNSNKYFAITAIYLTQLSRFAAQDSHQVSDTSVSYRSIQCKSAFFSI
jgi:ABC-type polysaccharide/polyol phosphate transport system ATPase subunit